MIVGVSLPNPSDIAYAQLFSKMSQRSDKDHPSPWLTKNLEVPSSCLEFFRKTEVKLKSCPPFVAGCFCIDCTCTKSNRTYTVEWTGTTDGRFEIDLYMCGSMCMEVCATTVAAAAGYVAVLALNYVQVARKLERGTTAVGVLRSRRFSSPKQLIYHSALRNVLLAVRRQPRSGGCNWLPNAK